MEEPAPADRSQTESVHDDGPAPDTTGYEPTRPELHLDEIERELADVERALARLDDGTYWTDEITGAALSEELLSAAPTSRRAAPETALATERLTPPPTVSSSDPARPGSSTFHSAQAPAMAEPGDEPANDSPAS